MEGNRKFAAYAWGVVGYNLAVIVWGAYVRASSSGAGCGERWPLCNGQFLPSFPNLARVIEFLHRVSSGLDVLLVLGLLAGAWGLYRRGHRVRRVAGFATLFIFTEALIGASLVLFGLVDQNLSIARVCVLSLHLVNTLFLLASLALTAAWAGARGWTGAVPSPARWLARGWVIAGLAGLLVTGVCGAIAALVDTLYPAQSLAVGMRQDFSSATRLLVRLRVIHPAVAIVVGLYLLYLVVEQQAGPRRLGMGLAAAVVLQWSLGAADVLLLTPLWLQMLHLLVADGVWILFVLYAAAG